MRMADSPGHSAPLVEGMPLGARVELGGVAQRPGQRLELALDDVVRVAAVRARARAGDLRLGHERLQDVPGHRRVVVADHRRHALGLGVHQVRAAGQVDGHLGERLVQRHRRVAEPHDARSCRRAPAEGGAERERGVLDRVVAVDVQVALGLDGQVEQAVLAELVEHVVVEADAGGDVDLPGAVEIDLDEDLGLLGGALDAAHAAHCHRWSPSSAARTASRNASFSSGVPAVTRSQPGRPTSRTSTPCSSSACQTACASANRPNRTKLASESATSQPDGAQLGARAGRARP